MVRRKESTPQFPEKMSGKQATTYRRSPIDFDGSKTPLGLAWPHFTGNCWTFCPEIRKVGAAADGVWPPLTYSSSPGWASCPSISSASRSNRPDDSRPAGCWRIVFRGLDQPKSVPRKDAPQQKRSTSWATRPSGGC